LSEKIEEVNRKIYLEFKVKQAEEIVKRAVKLFPGRVAVAFSGGKDSFVVLHIALKVKPDIPVVFNNTTVEFPETLSYLRMLKESWNLHLYLTKPEKSYFSMVKERDWASHQNRWCCQPCKEQPNPKTSKNYRCRGGNNRNHQNRISLPQNHKTIHHPQRRISANLPNI